MAMGYNISGVNAEDSHQPTSMVELLKFLNYGPSNGETSSRREKDIYDHCSALRMRGSSEVSF